MNNEEKAKINVLLNVDNFTGESTGRMAPMLIFMAVTAAPFLLWMMISSILPFKIFIIFEILWGVRWALFILGKENKRLAIHRNNKRNVYDNAKKLIRTTHIYDDGLIEYMSGKVGYIISAQPKDYLNDAKFTYDLEQFLKQLDGYEFDVYLHNIVDEDRLEDSFESLTVYKDKEVIRDRIEMLTINDEVARNTTAGYRFNLLVKSSKYSWKRLKEKVESVVKSDYAKMFNYIYVCDKHQVSDVASRDIRIWIDLHRMLTQKYENEEYFGSSVLFYGDDVPEELKAKKEETALDERRVDR